jgi:hypothetical protein
MMTPETAKKQLEAWHAPEGIAGEDRLLSAAKELPDKLRAIAYVLLGRDAKGKSLEFEDADDAQQQARACAEEIARLDLLPPKERLRLFAGLLGDLAPAVEAAWQSLKKSTYQTGYQRKSFRAPDHPLVTLDLREHWLKAILEIVQKFQPGVVTVPWLAAWTPHLGYHVDQNDVGRLLAAAIDAGGPQGDEVFDILCRSVTNEHEIGAMGRHVSRALLMASRPEGWELMEKTLLAAQRQEGLRQVILETVDEAHPEAYRRMLRLIHDHDLARFSAVVRAVDVWFGLHWDSASVKVVNRAIESVLGFLNDPSSREKALASREQEAVFLALWSVAFSGRNVSRPSACSPSSRSSASFTW